MFASRRKIIQGAVGATILQFVPTQFAWGAKMVAVRMWPAEEYTRVTLELDTAIEYKHFIIRSSRPFRFVVDLYGLNFTASLREQIEAVKPEDPYIAKIRIGQYKPGIVRMVMDLKRDVKPDVFMLKPFDQYKYRLVFDIYPARPKDEIGRILAGMDRTRAREDVLGSLIANLDTQTGKKSTPATSLTPAKKPSKPKTTNKLVIVVDPGHGGEDPGAIGRRKTKEKDIVLAISKLLYAEINKEPNMKAVLTRSSDHFVRLSRRVQIAQRNKAHLLVSIHADAWTKASARGSSVFALSETGASSAAARWLAQRQNESDLIGGVSLNDAPKELQNVLVDMTKNWSINYSLSLGQCVLEEMKRFNRLHKTKVEQAGFAVLKGHGIPSILVETAFISNPQEELLLRQKAHQLKIAKAIVVAIKKQLAIDPTILYS